MPPEITPIGGKTPGWWLEIDLCSWGSVDICHPCNSPFPKPSECYPPWVQEGGVSDPDKCYPDHSYFAAYQIPATKGTGYLVDGTTLAPPINRFPYIPGTLLSWCPNNCRPPKESGNYGLCFSNISTSGCDTEGNDFGTVVRPTPWKEPKLTQKLISSTVPNNKVNNDITRTSKLITTNPIRTLSVNPYGQLYIQNYARFTQGGITEEFKKHGIHSTTYPDIDIKYIRIDGDEPKYPDFTQISHGQTYACGIYTNGCILYDSLFTTPNQGCTLLTDNYLYNRSPWPSDLVFWNKTNRVSDGGRGWNLIDERNEVTLGGVNDALHPLTLDWANTPFFISGNKSATGEGDVFATIWTNTSNPYRSFGMNYFRVYEGFGDGGSEGISWQANYSDIPDGVFGVRPDLLIWRAANQLYSSYFTKGFTGCSGWGGTGGGICSNLEWDGWSGWTAPMCNKDRAYPSTVYYKQISLGNQHGLVSLGHYTPNEGITANNIQELDDAENFLHFNRREKIEWLFQFSGSTAANIIASSDWSTENLNIKEVPSYILDPAESISFPNSAITKLTYTRKDFTYEVGITAESVAPGGPDQEIRIPDTYNNFCRWSSVDTGIDDEVDSLAPLIGNPYICNPSLSIGFTCCFRSAITFGHPTHPIWTDSSKIPNIFVLSAAAVSRLINDANTTNASWEWISAGSSGNSCAILSYNDSGKTNISDTIRKCICWGPRYDKSDIEYKHWPDVNIQEHYTMEQGCSGYAMGITWHPCQVDCSLESPIFYHKSWPYSSYHIDGPASYLYTPGYEGGKSYDPNAGRVTYNTLAKVTVWDGISWSHQSNATIDDPIATHYKYTGPWPPSSQEEYSSENIKINKILNFPNGLNNFHDYTWNGGQTNDYQWWGWYKAYPNWGTYPITFLPRDISFNSSRLHHFGYPQDTPVQWMNQLNFPSWTPIYPVVSGNSWLTNLFDNDVNQPNVCCLFDGITGCCETDEECYPGIERYDCDFLGGTWTEGQCDQSYCDNKCYNINTDTVQFTVDYSEQTKTVNLSSGSPVCTWTAQTNDNWLVVSTKSSTDNVININISENTSTQNRLGTVTVTQANPQNIKIIRINQLADNGGGGGGGGGGVDCCDYFTGPCCTNTQCEENKTPQECHNSKGIFLGFNKTCDDCPT